MIYTYHRVKFKIEDTITITPLRFFFDMFGLLGKKVVNLNEYCPDNKNHVVLTFDDGYRDFLKYAFPILKFFRYPFELCICNDFLSWGAKFLNIDDLKFLVNNGARLQYHGKSHKDLTTLETDDEILEEIICPENIKELDKEGFRFFVYPNWNTNNHIAELVAKNGYIAGLSHKECVGGGSLKAPQQLTLELEKDKH